MTYTKKQFLEDVKKEAVALKKNATDAELSRLDIERFDGGKSELCIYGLISGNCFSERGVELIEKCAPIFLEHDDAGAPMMVTSAERNSVIRWSPVEAYAHDSNNKIKNLIDFLKGNRTDLVL